MKIAQLKWHRLSVLLPLVMTVMQSGLFAASLMFQHEPWVIPDPGPYPPPAVSDCSGNECTVTFSPAPEPHAGAILKAALLINLPAVFLGSILHAIAGSLHIPQLFEEPTLIGYSVIFVPLIWYRTGKWADSQLADPPVATHAVSIRYTWRVLVRVGTWFLFFGGICSFLISGRRVSGENSYLLGILILWTGVYLAVGLLSDWRTKH